MHGNTGIRSVHQLLHLLFHFLHQLIELLLKNPILFFLISESGFHTFHLLVQCIQASVQLAHYLLKLIILLCFYTAMEFRKLLFHVFFN